MAILEMKLNSGRLIGLHTFFLRETYADMILGSPSKRLNEFITSSISSQAKESLGNAPVVLIEPQLIKSSDGSERLPRFLCMGAFVSFSGTEEGAASRTVLSICWFEEAATLHISNHNRERIDSLDWDAQCSERNRT